MDLEQLWMQEMNSVHFHLLGKYKTTHVLHRSHFHNWDVVSGTFFVRSQGSPRYKPGKSRKV